MATYDGFRTSKGCVVRKDNLRLSPERSQKVRNHSPDGFEWGYGGSGPAQLALAILMEEVALAVAQENYQRFKFKVIARLPKHVWSLTSDQIANWIESEGRSASLIETNEYRLKTTETGSPDEEGTAL